MKHETKIRTENTKGLISCNGFLLKKGDIVAVPEPDEKGIHTSEFAGTVTGFRNENVVVEDQDGNAFEFEPIKVVLTDEDGMEEEPYFCKTNNLKIKDIKGEVIDLFDQINISDPNQVNNKFGTVMGFFGGIMLVQDAECREIYVRSEFAEIAEQDKERLVLVMNDTDGFTAAPNEMKFFEAVEFCKNFHKRYAVQGYYRDGRGERIPPETVRLSLMNYTAPEEEKDEEVETIF